VKDAVVAHALELGFDLCRVTHAGDPESAPAFDRWLASGHHGQMEYLARNGAKRKNPQMVLPGARSIIVVAVSYAAGEEGEPARVAGTPTGVVARYARHADYHEVLGERLEALTCRVNELGGPGTRSLWYVDTGPLLERDLAQRAGVGFAGKHTNLISRELGNWFLLAEILTTAELPPDPAERNRCGSCVRCLAACPTQAIVAPFELDARRCISYLTIELKGSIPEALRPAIGARVFGCDDCLAVCPWNRFARLGALMSGVRRDDLGQPRLLEWLRLDDDGFRRRFQGTPMMRTKRRGVLRNVCVALGNIGDGAVLPDLERAGQDPEPLIAEHARWALERVRSRLRDRSTGKEVDRNSACSRSDENGTVPGCGTL
jgi:epoxyqueuosine reductase